MPRKPRVLRKRTTAFRPEELAYLTDSDEHLDGWPGYVLGCYRRSGVAGIAWAMDPRELWDLHRDEFLPEYIKKNPGKRPTPWWQWDAPRWADPHDDYYFHGKLPEPRRRIGGSGTPWHDDLSIHPTFRKGIPSYFRPDIDPDDPPVYESQAVYLDRHGLLTSAEKAYLKAHPALLQPETINWRDYIDEDE